SPAFQLAGAGNQDERQIVAECERTDGDAAGLEHHHTKRDCWTAAWMNEVNSGCGSNGLDFNSGWNCTPMNHGWSGRSTISGRTPSGDMPENTMPTVSNRSL